MAKTLAPPLNKTQPVTSNAPQILTLSYDSAPLVPAGYILILPTVLVPTLTRGALILPTSFITLIDGVVSVGPLANTLTPVPVLPAVVA